MTRAVAGRRARDFRIRKRGAIYGIYMSLVYLATRSRRLDRGPPPRPAPRRALRRHHHRARPLPPGRSHRSRSSSPGLVLIVFGTGLLKPNISTMVGSSTRTDDARRDAGFSIFYMGINIGALIAPIVCDYLGENVGWHYGFGAAGIGMTLGIIQYLAGWRFLGDAGGASSRAHGDFRIFRTAVHFRRRAF